MMVQDTRDSFNALALTNEKLKNILTDEEEEQRQQYKKMGADECYRLPLGKMPPKPPFWER